MKTQDLKRYELIIRSLSPEIFLKEIEILAHSVLIFALLSFHGNKASGYFTFPNPLLSKTADLYTVYLFSGYVDN